MVKVTDTLLELTAQIVSAHVGKNPLDADRLPELIREVYRALANTQEAPEEIEGLKPAVPITRSVFNDYIVCLEDGKKMKTMKRHLMTDHNMTPEQYRARWGLPPTYPTVAPAYAETRSALAKKIGLGQKRTLGRRGGRGRGGKGI